MGFRTVVMLCNDYAHEWEKDPMLGKKIARAMNYAGEGGSESPIDEYGAVVQCVHADTQTIAVLDGYTKFVPLAYRGWRRDEQDDEVNLALLKEAAAKMGYRLTKLPAKKEET